MTLHPDDYHAHPAMSATRLKAMVTGTALDYWAKHVDPEREVFQPTDAMRQGSLVDCLLTEPTEFHKRYAVLPADAPKKPTSSQRNAAKPSEATVLAIAWWDQWLLSNDGKEVVNEEWIDTAHAIASRLRADPAIGPLLASLPTKQKPHFWTDAEGRECRYKPDLEVPGQKILLDLKKTVSAHPLMFRNQAWKLGYDVQLAHYSLGYADRHGFAPEQTGFIAYEWKKPYNYSLVWADEEFMDEGFRRRDEAFDRIAECEARNEWPSYGEAWIVPPAWADVSSADDDTNLDDLGLEGL